MRLVFCAVTLAVMALAGCSGRDEPAAPLSETSPRIQSALYDGAPGLATSRLDPSLSTAPPGKRYTPRFYDGEVQRLHCVSVFGDYDRDTAASIEGHEGRRVAAYKPFEDGLVVFFKDGGRTVAWNSQIDCKDPPYDAVAKVQALAPTPAVAPDTPQGISPAPENEESRTSLDTDGAKISGVFVPKGPGFNCNKAKTQVEHLICADDYLSAADRRMNELYNEVLAARGDKSVFKREQDEWRKHQRDTCRDALCIRNAYDKRNAALAMHS